MDKVELTTFHTHFQAFKVVCFIYKFRAFSLLTKCSRTRLHHKISKYNRTTKSEVDANIKTAAAITIVTLLLFRKVLDTT